MKITIEVEESRITELVQQRVGELFSTDARYRETGVRQLVQRIVDEAAVSAVRQAQNAIAATLPEYAKCAVEKAIQEEIGKTAKRGVAVLRKLYAGFDPQKLTPEHRAWLETQIGNAAQEKA